jgi:hypothetical protein
MAVDCTITPVGVNSYNIDVKFDGELVTNRLPGANAANNCRDSSRSNRPCDHDWDRDDDRDRPVPDDDRDRPGLVPDDAALGDERSVRATPAFVASATGRTIRRRQTRDACEMSCHTTEQLLNR